MNIFLEIRRVRGNVFCISGAESLHLPEPLGPVVTLCEKIIIPTREFPEVCMFSAGCRCFNICLMTIYLFWLLEGYFCVNQLLVRYLCHLLVVVGYFCVN